VVEFSDGGTGVWHFLDQYKALLVGDVLDFKMVDAVHDSRSRACWLWTVVVGPTRSYIRGQHVSTEYSPAKDDDNGDRRQAPCGPPPDINAGHIRYPLDILILIATNWVRVGEHNMFE